MGKYRGNHAAFRSKRQHYSHGRNKSDYGRNRYANLTGTVINANITAQGGILKINNSSLAYSGIITMAGGTLDFTSATLGANAVLNMNGTGVLKNAAIDGAKLTYTESGSSFTKENVTFTSGTIDIGGALDSLVEGEQDTRLI